MAGLKADERLPTHTCALSKEWGAGLPAGSEPFFSGSFSYADFDGTTLSLKGLGATVGYEFPSESEVAVCLGATGSYGFGLEILGR